MSWPSGPGFHLSRSVGDQAELKKTINEPVPSAPESSMDHISVAHSTQLSFNEKYPPHTVPLTC